ncbi:MAG TPA: hypothetical protein GX713_04150 [Mollicutes bacterium]|nr:hypothetical protein [Mollicutes bacterium]
MNKIDFLKENLISNKGLYDNVNIFENTLESFSKAIDNNLIIYLKVRLTKDKVPVIYSDSNLARLMNLKDRVDSTKYEELIYLNKYHIPTLKEVLKLIDGKTPIIINPTSSSDKYYLQKEVVKLLDNYKGKFAILSSNPLIIRWFNKNKPEYLTGEIITKKRKVKSLPRYLANFTIKVDFKSVDIEYYNLIKLKKLKENSLVIGYLIDSKEKYNIYKNALDNIFISELFKND